MEQIKQSLQALGLSKTSMTSTTPNFDEVELTPEEMARIIQEAKEKKYWKLEDERLKREKIERYQDAVRPWSAQEMFNQAKRAAGPEYKLDQYVAPVFKQLSLYFSGDPEFEKSGMKLSKGIMLIGAVGVGKTELLKAFRFNKRCCFVPESCNEVERRCRQNGLDFWKTYAGFVPGHGNTEKLFYQPNIGWMLDDLGTEEVILDYGNKLDALEKIISQRYLVKDDIPFATMHLTTNLNGDLMDRRYGQRMTSRLREMFNIIVLKGDDRRK